MIKRKEKKINIRVFKLIILSFLIVASVIIPEKNMIALADTVEDGSSNLKIGIEKPEGWKSDDTDISIKLEDVSDNIKVDKVEAKTSQNAKFSDITDDMEITVSENCTVYVQVTDTDGKVYSKSRYIDCFDREKPTLNASLTAGLLSVIAYDTQSGIKAVYVNGYEFTELTNNSLNIRLQQYDTRYEKISIQALDNAGNMSVVYSMVNPYYQDPTKEETKSNESVSSSGGSTSNTSKTSSTVTGSSNLPLSAIATDPTVARGTTSEIQTEDGQNSTGKEFFTITTKGNKTFYMIVDKGKTDNNVYLLTEVSGNDLLNFVDDNGNTTLPQTATGTVYAVPEENSNGEKNKGNADSNAEEESKKENEKKSSSVTIIIVILIVAGIGAGYYFLKIRKKDNYYDDDFEDEEYEDEGIYENDEAHENEDNEVIDNKE